MAIGKHSNLKIYDEQFYGGMWETVTQNTAAFNGASRNAIRLVAADTMGAYKKESFFQNVSDLITRRDLTSTSTVTDLAAAQSELVNVKLRRKIGPLAMTIGSVHDVGLTPEEFSFQLGQVVGAHKVKDLLNTSVLAVETAIAGQSDLVYDATGLATKTIKTEYLVRALAKMGDQAGRVVAWVMHSKPFHDLLIEQIDQKVTNVNDVIIYGGSPGTLGRPVIVADIPALTDANGSATDTYNTLGLVANAVVAEEGYETSIYGEIVTGLENLVFRAQGEYDYNVGVKGFAWNTSGGGANPNDTALGTTSNWTKAMTSVKDLAGVRIVTQ